MHNYLAKNIKICPKDFWPPYSPDANPLDFTFGPHVESRACKVRHPNLAALKASVDREWAAMSADTITNGCKAFRRRLAAILAADGGRIND